MIQEACINVFVFVLKQTFLIWNKKKNQFKIKQFEFHFFFVTGMYMKSRWLNFNLSLYIFPNTCKKNRLKLNIYWNTLHPINIQSVWKFIKRIYEWQHGKSHIVNDGVFVWFWIHVHISLSKMVQMKQAPALYMR